MYLYSITEDESYVKKVLLLQHTENYTQEEFEDMTREFTGVGNGYMGSGLSEKYGFRIVPSVSNWNH